MLATMMSFGNHSRQISWLIVGRQCSVVQGLDSFERDCSAREALASTERSIQQQQQQQRCCAVLCLLASALASSGLLSASFGLGVLGFSLGGRATLSPSSMLASSLQARLLQAPSLRGAFEAPCLELAALASSSEPST